MDRRYAARIARLTLMDDLYMSKFFDGQTQCAEEVLKAVLGKPDLHVLQANAERPLVNLETRSARVDVLAVDDEGRRYDIEVQRDLNRASPQRARFNAALMDVDALPKGADPAELPESYVVFITDGDSLGQGVPLQHFERINPETGGALGDGSHIVYADAAYNGYGDTPLGRVMHDFKCADPDAMRCPVLAERARHLKETEEGVGTMSDWLSEWKAEVWEGAVQEGLQKGLQKGLQEGLQQGLQKGLQEGLQEGRADAAAKLLKDGTLSPEKIAAVLGMTVDEVERCGEAQTVA